MLHRGNERREHIPAKHIVLRSVSEEGVRIPLNHRLDTFINLLEAIASKSPSLKRKGYQEDLVRARESCRGDRVRHLELFLDNRELVMTGTNEEETMAVSNCAALLIPARDNLPKTTVNKLIALNTYCVGRLDALREASDSRPLAVLLSVFRRN